MKNNKKSIISLFMAFAMAATPFGVSASQQSNTVLGASHSAADSGIDFELETLEPVNLDEVENLYPFPKSNDTDSSRSRAIEQISTEEPAEAVTENGNFVINSNVKIDDETALTRGEGATRSTRAGTYAGYEFSDVLTYEGQQYPIYPLWLTDGQLLQAQLTIPQSTSLNYDLILAEFDLTTGSLKATPTDLSTMPTTTAYTPEGVATENTSGADAAYAVIVVSTAGYDESLPFTLNITISDAGTFDGGEPNDNIYSAVTIPSLESIGQYVQFNANLNTPYDNDWYAFYVPELQTFSAVDLITSGTLNIETYYVNSSGIITRNSAHQTSGTYQLKSGYNYFRVSNQGTHSADSYSIKISPNTSVEYFSFDYIVDGTDCIRSSTNFEDGAERLLLLTGRDLEWRVTYYNSAGYPMPNVYNPLKIHYWNPAWGNFNENPGAQYDHANRIRTSENDYSAGSGYNSCTVPCGSVYELNSSGMGWDQVTVYFEMPNVGFETSQQMALVTKYNDGEKEKACYFHGIEGHSF